MASAGRFAAIIRRKSTCSRPNSIPKIMGSNHQSALAFSSPANQYPVTSFRFESVLGSLRTMLPLRSAIAAARLKSNIAVDTARWSWLSRDFAVPR